MGFWKGVGKLAAGTLVVTGKAAVGSAKLTIKGVAAVGSVVYDHREQLGRATSIVAKGTAVTVGVAGYGAYKSTEWVAKQAIRHRHEIGGAVVGIAKGMGTSAADVAAYASAREAVAVPIIERIGHQSIEYQQLIRRTYGRIDAASARVRKRDVLLDSLVVGGNTLSTYADFLVSVPSDVERAYQLAYPDLAEVRAFVDEVRSLDASQIEGFISGVKGKLFELKYTAYLKDGHLPDGFDANLAPSATQPGWDIAITGPDGHMREVIQAKATDSVAYVKRALNEYPHIDVVTTDEVHGQLLMQGLGNHVMNSGIADSALHNAVHSATDSAVAHFSWVPSSISLALIAFSAYSKEGLDAYQKSKNFGERSTRSYLAYIAGGAVAVATGTWWLGILGGVGSRLLLGRGHAKRERLAALRRLADTNERVLDRLRRQQAF